MIVCIENLQVWWNLPFCVWGMYRWCVTFASGGGSVPVECASSVFVRRLLTLIPIRLCVRLNVEVFEMVS